MSIQKKSSNSTVQSKLKFVSNYDMQFDNKQGNKDDQNEKNQSVRSNSSLSSQCFQKSWKGDTGPITNLKNIKSKPEDQLTPQSQYEKMYGKKSIGKDAYREILGLGSIKTHSNNIINKQRSHSNILLDKNGNTITGEASMYAMINADVKEQSQQRKNSDHKIDDLIKNSVEDENHKLASSTNLDEKQGSDGYKTDDNNQSKKAEIEYKVNESFIREDGYKPNDIKEKNRYIRESINVKLEEIEKELEDSYKINPAIFVGLDKYDKV